MDYEQASDFEINMAVAISLGIAVDPQIPKGTPIGDYAWVGRGEQTFSMAPIPDYCNNPSDAWPIIVENNIQIRTKPPGHIGTPNATDIGRQYKTHCADNIGLLRSAMIVYLKMQEEK